MRRLTGVHDIVTARQIKGTALLTAFCERLNLGVAYSLDAKSNFATVIKTVADQFPKAQASEITIKLIGAETILKSVEANLNVKGARIEKVVAKESSFTAIFHLKQGRLRVERESAPVAVAVAEPKQIVGKIKVLVIDDSSTIQKLLKTILEADPGCEVVGTVSLPSQAEDAIKKLKPDVITMDVHMPEMTGVELLKILHPKYGIPTVMITSVSREEGDVVLDALSSGAVDYIQKPSFSEIDLIAPMIVEKVKVAARAKAKAPASHAPRRKLVGGSMDLRKFIAIGSSTGGTEALREVFERLPAEIPPIVVVQHIPAVFSEALARRLNDLCPFEVKEAADGDDLRAGRVLIAPGGKQMKVVSGGSEGFRVRVFDGEPVNRHKPSVDVLFDSVAAEIGSKAVGVILTGMGADGARGLVKMRERGSHTIAQDEASCVVFGMPREAIRMGGAEEVAALDTIADRLVSALSHKKKSA